MDEREDSEPKLIWGPEAAIPTKVIIAGLSRRGWRGRVGELEPAALKAFLWEALLYARWEIRQYRRWRAQKEPVLPNGYDAEGVVQEAFGRLMSREAGGVPIFYTAEAIRKELRALVKHRVRWFHQRKETGVVVSEWEGSPVRGNGELVSIFNYVSGSIGRPDEEVIDREQEKLLREFKAGFDESLGQREQLADVFRGIWAGEKRREIAGRLGMGVERIKSLQKEVNRRLAHFAAEARGGVAEMLGSFKNC
jgi:hypothetical protein